MATFFDTHAHLDFPDFASDIAEVVTRAQAAGIERIISIGTDLASSARALALAERFPCVFAAVGWHPGHAEEAPDDFRAELRALAAHPKAVAIGECGFDYYRLPSANGGTSEDDARVKAKQAIVFRQQLEVAAEVGLNVVVHTRGGSFDDTMTAMEPLAGKVRGVFHCFVGTPAEMQRVVAQGSLVSFTGIATFKNAADIRTTLAATPMGKFMLETDCPFLAPVPYRGKRCEPAYVKELAAVVAEVKGCSLTELSTATSATAREFFPRMQ
ncbi:MAG TPA: TatD family hydrolase [Candidatus Limnocylindria bacterium]|nr:TatD family hydrolase [Candidatus Limnocylindria bacterium]